MTSIEEKFKKASQNVKNLKKRPNNEILLQLYGLYKQATTGDNTTPKPGMMAGLVARGKWDAWTTQKGLTKDEAAGKYV